MASTRAVPLALALTALAGATLASSAQARPVSDAAASSIVRQADSVQTQYFSAVLSGRNEVAAAGDPDGSAKSVVQINGSRVTFGFSWKNIAAPTMAHIHVGAAGVNGPVTVPFFMSALPVSTTATVGSLTVEDAGLVQAITANPAGYYLNLHTADFPGGAVRGQLQPVREGSDPLELIDGMPLQAIMDGAHEVPALGDPDGSGVSLIRASGRRVEYAFSWQGISQPVMAHIHDGPAGVRGPVVVPLFMTAIPENIVALAGEVTGVDKMLVTDIREHPADYYTNLHTTDFPGGAVRGQLFRAGHL